MKTKILLKIILISFSLFPLEGFSQIVNSFSKQDKQNIIDSLLYNLNLDYVYADVSAKITSIFNSKEFLENVDSINNPFAFSQYITKEMRTVTSDKHLWLWYNPSLAEEEKSKKNKQVDFTIQDCQNNFGFQKLTIYNGNVGYLKLDEFSYSEFASEKVEATFTFLKDCDALIIDLKDNSGGSPEMVQLLCSYLIKNPTKMLNTMSYRDSNITKQFWSYYFIPGYRFTERPVFILTSKRTASAAEEFAYNIQTLKRGTIIGETTRGAAHDNKFIILNDHFVFSLPFARALNPITKTNWENIGVIPDIQATNKNSFNLAYTLSLKEIIKKTDEPSYKRKLEGVLMKLNKDID